MVAGLDCHVAEGLPREPYVGEDGPFLAQALCLYR